jgi:hypothetical protein
VRSKHVATTATTRGRAPMAGLVDDPRRKIKDCTSATRHGRRRVVRRRMDDPHLKATDRCTTPAVRGLMGSQSVDLWAAATSARRSIGD